MKVMLKVASSITVGALAIGALDVFLHWMNQPSNRSFYLGTLGALTTLVLSAIVIGLIWRSGLRRRF